MSTTKLSVLLSRMNRYTEIETIETQFKVRDLDDAIRAIRREMVLPWTLKKTTLRAFNNVLEYAVKSDHDEFAFFDNSEKYFAYKPRMKFTSTKEFYENPDKYNDVAEIWKNNTRVLGVRYKSKNTTEQRLNNAEVASTFSVADDATAVTKDTVFFYEGNASMRIDITLTGASLATIKDTFQAFSDTNYKRRYQFRRIYFPSVPTSVELRFQTDDSNYISTAGITTQFDGTPFKAGEWNLVAHDLNLASATGTFNSASIASEKILLTGAATGTYYVDASYARGWELLDYWYYSSHNVAVVGSTTGTQDAFYNSSEIYSTDSMLIGDKEWADVAMYEAITLGVTDEENNNVYAKVERRRVKAWKALMSKYPDMVPTITTSRYMFNTDYAQDNQPYVVLR